MYANPHANIRKYLWGKLNVMRIEHPWLIIGDFNCILREEERSSGKWVSSCSVEWVVQRGLIDMGYIRLIFTWNHGMNVDTRHSARLDKGLCDESWRWMFPSVRRKYLTHPCSDHCPLLLQLEVLEKNRVGDRPFRFHASWILHRDFFGLLEREGRWARNLPHTLREFVMKLHA